MNSYDCVLVTDSVTAMLAQNQLLFNLNPTVQPPALPVRFHPPDPIVINKFNVVSFSSLCCSLLNAAKFVKIRYLII